jgi:adenine-specific DNA-methyltransferase
MSSRKNTGSYYTPSYLASFVVQYLLPEVALTTDFITFLEPSAGDGIFVQALLREVALLTHLSAACVRTVEREPAESAKVEKLLETTAGENVVWDCSVGDFLEIQSDLQPEYRLILGNPPYLNKKRLTQKQIDVCTSINEEAGLPTFVSNIWTAFVLRSTQLLTADGVMAFVLPAEILQVKYAIAVKEYLYKSFDRIEFFDFKELLFDAKGQGTILFIGYKKTNKEAGVFFTNIHDTAVLKTRDFQFKKQYAVELEGFRVKESHHDLPQEDLELLYRIRREVKAIQHYATSKPGVVTAANDYFIVNQEKLDAYDLNQFSKAIIQKGALVNGKVEFTQEDFKKLSQAGTPTYLLDFNNKPAPEAKAREYLDKGEAREIHKRYKCLQRDRWYDIPNVSGPGEALFFKRCHEYPKLLKNTANVLVTDSAYKVALKPDYDIDSFVFSFYNSLTMAFAELEGRHYGGGVLELIPSEFKRLPMVYTPRTKDEFNYYAEQFKRKQSISEILDSNDEIVLRQIPGMTSEAIETIKRIRQLLLNRRFRV